MKNTALISILSLIILSGCDREPSNKISEEEFLKIQQQIAKQYPVKHEPVGKAKIINFKSVHGGENEQK